MSAYGPLAEGPLLSDRLLGQRGAKWVGSGHLGKVVYSNDMTISDLAGAEKLAAKLNINPIAFFGLWLGPMLIFWAQTLGPLKPFDVAPPIYDAWPWLTSSLVSGATVLLLPLSWYRTQPFEKSGKVYKYLGITAFRQFVTNGDLINRAVRSRHPNYRVFQYEELRSALRRQCFQSERSHLVAFAAGAVASIYALQIDWHGWAIWLTVTNIGGNLLPALVQRSTRARLSALQNRKKQKLS